MYVCDCVLEFLLFLARKISEQFEILHFDSRAVGHKVLIFDCYQQMGVKFLPPAKKV